MKKATCKWLVIMSCALSCLLSITVLAQPRLPIPTYPRTNYWLTVGVGTTQHISFMSALSVQPAHRQRVYTARYVASGELFFHDYPGIRTAELGGLYGVRLRRFILSAGLGTVWGVERGAFIRAAGPHDLHSNYYERIAYRTLGLPVEVRFVLRGKHADAGITAFGNLNNRRPYVGVNLSIYGGKMR